MVAESGALVSRLTRPLFGVWMPLVDSLIHRVHLLHAGPRCGRSVMGMPFRSQRTLDAWLAEFREQGHPVAGSLKVMEQDGHDGADTGLVGVRLANATTVTYIQPERPYSLN